MKTKHLLRCFAALSALSIATVILAQNRQTQTRNGYDLPPGWEMPVMDHMRNTFTLLEKFEFRTGKAEDAAVYDAQGWIGGDHNRLWWKAEGEQERRSPKTGEFELQALYGRLVRPFWDVQAGVRFDRRYSGPNRDTRAHLALGLQGLAPYWFELEPTFFLSDEGDVSFKLEASYELLIAQRLVLEPRIDLAAAFQDETQRGVGAGFNDVELGLRLRYDITRQIGPYIGVTWRRALGETAGMRRRAGENVSVSALVLGLRAWF